MTDNPLIKATPMMTNEEMIVAIQSLQTQTGDFINKYQSKNYGNKVREDGRVIMSKGRQEVGSANNILILSGEDATYRMWVGHKTAASAPLRITKEGALYAGSTLITGRYSGAVVSTAMESGWNSSSWTVASGSTGVYTVTHNLGHTNYLVLVSALATNVKECSVSARNSNDFVVKIANATGTLEANDFFFELILKS